MTADADYAGMHAERIRQEAEAAMIEVAKRSAAETAKLADRVSTLEAQQGELLDSLGWALVAIAELVAFRDTGAVHRQCKACLQIIPVTMTGQFMPHSIPLQGPPCVNSGGHV